jgi:phytoene desaturase
MLTRSDPAAPAILPEGRRPHAVVIGSGLGGLAAAVRMGARGYRVTVLERLDAPGGRAYVYRKDGFTFDGGPTIITAPHLLEELWTLCGKRMADHCPLVSLDPFYRILFHDGEMFDAHGDAGRAEAEILRLAPQDLEGYRAFMARSEAIYRYGFEELAHIPFGDFTEMLRVTPELLRLGSLNSVYGLVSRYFTDERLRFAYSFHPLFVGGNPFKATAMYCLISYLERAAGVHFAVGGTGALVKGLVDLMEGQGGAIRYDADVAQIRVENGAATGVVLTSGEVIAADVVVSNADAAVTYNQLLPEGAPGRWDDFKVARGRYSMGLVVWYFGTNRRYEDVPHHSIVLGPRYRGLIADIFDRKVLADDFSLYLHRPTATDRSLAPDGCDAFYVLSPVPHQASGVDWAVHGPAYKAAIRAELERRLLPGLSDAIVSEHMVTPADFQTQFRAHQGAAFGLEALLTQSAWFRPHNRSDAVRNLYLVGAGTHPGAGVPGVLSSARVLDSVLPPATAHV